jgi:thymidylate synthase (FAD)
VDDHITPRRRKLKVGLISFTKDPEITCAKCAAVSWRRKGMKEMSLDEARDVVRRVIGYGHESVIEHACFTFFVENISRGLTHQLVRHRIASYTQQSMRYVDLSKSSNYFIKPRTISEKEELNELFDDVMTKCKNAYDRLRKSGIPPEDSRFVLPIATQTKIAVTMNARELGHFFSMRCCLRAQWEIQQLANNMLRICKSVAPSLFENAGPSCVKLGYCPEGELTCGKLKKVLKIYRKQMTVSSLKVSKHKPPR